jgi:GTPase
MEGEEGFRSGFVGIVGRPNVGKSTLLNNLAHQKVAIISNKPQTTRNRIRCVVNTGEAQIVFIDTPGFHKPRNALGERLNKHVKETFSDVDVTLLVLDGTQTIGRGDLYISAELADLRTPVLVTLNKIDKLGGEQVEAQMSVAENLGDFHSVIPVSARTGENVHALIERIVTLLPEGPRYYPDDVVTDQPASFIVAELVREKIIRLTQEEVPHSVAVQVEVMEKREGSDIMDIRAIVFVERDSQKGIIIGKGGKMLREVGSKARAEIEPLLGEHVFLDLHVKVEKDWTRRPGSIARLGL